LPVSPDSGDASASGSASPAAAKWFADTQERTSTIRISRSRLPTSISFVSKSSALTDISLEDDNQGTKIVPGLRAILHIINAIVHVPVNHFVSKRFQPASCRDHLVQDLRAVRILCHQSFDRLHLPPDLPQPKDESLLLFLRMDVFHAPSYTGQRSVAKRNSMLPS